MRGGERALPELKIHFIYSFMTAEKDVQVARKKGGGGNLGNARKKTFFFYMRCSLIGSHAILTHLHQVILEAVEKRLLFPGVDVTTVLGQRDCLQTRHISAIESDEAGEYAATWVVLEELGLEGQATTTDCRVVRWGGCFFTFLNLRAGTLQSALGYELQRWQQLGLQVCSTR